LQRLVEDAGRERSGAAGFLEHERADRRGVGRGGAGTEKVREAVAVGIAAAEERRVDTIGRDQLSNRMVAGPCALKSSGKPGMA
jgi:hypothetical protein